ncbi:Uncharacterized protein SCF082_LOCUS48338 [Durusdinium trenchii]|uniref:Uncharacterized protein n=1 Tax=Durusdinium trenchii TaxID=1381693 RepID=A0ABP0RU10_9DINO
MEGEEKEEARPGGTRGQNSAEWLHTGDLVLLKCHLRDDGGHEGTTSPETGYLRGIGMNATLEVEPIDDIESGTMDVRDFIFVVVEQLSYNAQKDLQKQKKRLNQLGIDPSSAHYAAQLRSLDARAKMEAQANLKKQHGKARSGGPFALASPSSSNISGPLAAQPGWSRREGARLQRRCPRTKDPALRAGPRQGAGGAAGGSAARGAAGRGAAQGRGWSGRPAERLMIAEVKTKANFHREIRKTGGAV